MFLIIMAIEGKEKKYFGVSYQDHFGSKELEWVTSEHFH